MIVFVSFKVVISSLFHAIPGIANVLLVCVVFWLIFSIMGVNLFGGKFYKCVDAHGAKYDVSIVPNKTACLERGDRWIKSNVNFDNSFNGFLALLQVVSVLRKMQRQLSSANSLMPCKHKNAIYRILSPMLYCDHHCIGRLYFKILLNAVYVDHINKKRSAFKISN